MLPGDGVKERDEQHGEIMQTWGGAEGLLQVAVIAGVWGSPEQGELSFSS